VHRYITGNHEDWGINPMATTHDIAQTALVRANANIKLSQALRDTQLEMCDKQDRTNRQLATLRVQMDDQFAMLQRDIGLLNGGQTTSRKDIAALDAKTTNLETDVARLTADVSVLQTDVAQLKTDVAELKTDVAQLKTDVAELKTDVAQLKTDVAELKSDVAELKASMGRVLELLERREAGR
jgi:chromosome segregation ATPase